MAREEYCPPQCKDGDIAVVEVVEEKVYGSREKFARVRLMTCIVCRGFGPYRPDPAPTPDKSQLA